MSFLLLLTIIFITLKLLGLIAWSWWLVFAPLLLEGFLVLLILAITGAIFGVSLRR